MLAVLRLPGPSRGTLVGGSIYGVIFFGGNFAFTYWGLQEAPAATASVINASVPLMAFGLAILHRVEVFRWRGLTGGLVALAGIVVIFGDQVSADVPVLSLLALLGGAVCAADVPALIKLIPRGHPIAINAIGMLVGGLLLAILSALVGERWAPPQAVETWMAVIFLILGGSVLVDFLYVFAIRHWTASAASYALIVIPPLTMLYGAVLLDEPIRPAFAAGGAIIMAGVWIGALAPTRRESVSR